MDGNTLSKWFNLGQSPSGDPTNPGQPQSSFFENLLNGAARGATQAFSSSTVGQNITGALVQGQSQVAAQNLFGNPLILVGAVLLAGMGLFALARR